MFGPDRAALLAAQLPATEPQDAADLQAREAALKARIARIETARNAKVLELDELPGDPAGQAYRARIRLTSLVSWFTVSVGSALWLM